MTTAISTASKSTLDLIQDWSTFKLLKPACQADVLVKLDGIRQIHYAIQTKTEKKADVIARVATQRRVGKATIYRELTSYRNKGEKGLIDHRRFPKGSGLPVKFESFIKGLFDQHQREDDGAEVYRKLIDRLNSWRTTGDPQYQIPGYETPPANHPSHDHPQSWSYKNILRLRPSKFERINIKRGEKDSNKYIPQVLTTRIGSAFMSRVMTDDQDYDNLLDDGTLALAGIKDAQRPVSFNALDFYTACHLDHHMRLEYKDPGTNKKKTLTSAEYQWFIIGILQKIGYRTDELGTVIVGEHKTAAGWQNKQLTTINGLSSLNDALHLVTDGHVSFAKSGLVNKALFAGLYFKPQSTGNFKFKTWIESSFRLLRTYMQAFPGQIGSNERLNGPAELHGIRHRVNQHARAIATVLDEHTATLIQRTLLDFPKFYQLVTGVYRAINSRDDHRLEGWAQCGFTRELWRPSPDSELWYEAHELESFADPVERQLICQRINSNRDQLTRTRSLSPEQARQLCMHREKGVLKKLKDEDVGLMLPWEWAKSATIGDGHAFTLANPLWPDARDTYVAQVKDSRGILTTLPHGMKLKVFANSSGDGRAHIYTEDREYVATIYPTVRAEPFDPEKAQVQLETRASVKSVISAQQRARMGDVAEERTTREKHNDRIHRGDFSTAEDRRSKGAKKAAETRHSNKVNKRAQEVDTAEALDAWASPSEQPEEVEELPSTDNDAFNPFTD